MEYRIKSRSRGDIIAQILEVANGGAGKTKIMFGACSSYAQLMNYLVMLESSELVVYDKIDNLYKTTEKGLLFVKTHEQIDRMLKPMTNSNSDQMNN